METYNAKQVGAMLGIWEKTVTHRAKCLGISKGFNNVWHFTINQIELIKSYVPKRFINTKFRFSEDGEYLIINSKINTLEL